MVPKKVMATLLVLYTVAMLAEQSEGYTAFFTREDFRKMEESEKNKAQRKSLSLQQRSEPNDFPEFLEDEGQIIKLTAPVEIGIYLNSRQLEKYKDVLQELLTEMLPNTRNGTVWISNFVSPLPWKFFLCQYSRNGFHIMLTHF
ncbi:promotilin [Anolis sagrei]|uniref:promotilin n=1 Tax=Anolis sagrei TaxID=38937 RepID=UPI003522CEE4